MPLDKYFKGRGRQVMANMHREYGAEKGTRIFYATVNARKKLRTGPRKAAING